MSHLFILFLIALVLTPLVWFIRQQYHYNKAINEILLYLTWENVSEATPNDDEAVVFIFKNRLRFLGRGAKWILLDTFQSVPDLSLVRRLSELEKKWRSEYAPNSYRTSGAERT